MDLRFDGKTVIVTGASKGIGAATALEFGRSGAEFVVVNYNRSADAAEEVVRRIGDAGGQAAAIQADVSNRAGVEKLIKESVAAMGERIDILVNNAGSLLERRLLQEMDDTLWDRTMDLNLKSIYMVTNAVLPYMKPNGYGRIINLTSIAARSGGGTGAGHYSAAKAGVLTLTKSYAKELAQSGITVNGVAPGIISTPFHDEFSSPELRETFKDLIPQGREGTPEETAAAIIFLASDQASHFIGETIEVNGGLLMD